MLTILEGSTFCLSDDLGDVDGETSGFFAWDTRFLSRLVLRIDGARPLPLSSGRLQALRRRVLPPQPEGERPSRRLALHRPPALHRHGAPGANRPPQREHGAPRLRALARARRRLRGHHLREAPRLRARRPGARAGASGARAGEARERERRHRPRGAGRRREHAGSSSRGPDGSSTGKLVFPLELDPHEGWELRLDILPSLGGRTCRDRLGRRATRRRARGPGRRRRGVDAPRSQAARRLGVAAPGIRPVHSPTSQRSASARARSAGRSSRPGCRGS